MDVANPSIRAVRDRLDGTAINRARALDERLARGEDIGPLGGLPIMVKENCDISGVVASAGLGFRKNRVAVQDSWVVGALRRAGAVLVGTGVSDLGAFGVRTAEVTHPLDATLTVGGSSGGSAAALLAGLCFGAIGTDTGGSVRIPSACCGTAALKPTFGSLSMDGIFPLVPSLDHVGPMACNVADVELLWNGLAGAAPMPPSKVKAIGFDPKWVEDAEPVVRQAFVALLERVRSDHIEVVEISLSNSIEH